MCQHRFCHCAGILTFVCECVCVCTVDILTCHHRMLLHATKAVLFGPWSNNYRVSLASVASWNLLVKSDILK